MQLSTLSAPYTVLLKFSDSDENAQVCNFAFNAILDSGSPISIIKSSFVPDNLCKPVDEACNVFCGINGSRLKILNIFEKDIEIEGITLKIKFYVVPDETINFTALLGRDFFTHPGINITLSDRVLISKKDDSVNLLKLQIEELMHIEYINEPEDLRNDLQINPEIDFETAEKLRNLFKDIYLKCKESEANEPDFEMQISLTHNQPISFRPRSLSFADKEKLRLILDNLINRGIIRPSSSPYASPIVLTIKKSGEARLCIDYREINKITVSDNFPCPLIDDNLDRLKDKKYFSTLDLKDGFHHVKIAKECVKYTSFITPLGQYEYLRCPYGLKNGTRVFTRFINLIFDSLVRDGKILLFVDDILIATEDVHEDLEILKVVFELAGRARLEFRLDKCHFMQTEIDYLGYHISMNGIRPTNDNIMSVLDYPLPRNTRQVLRFVCLASYFRRFIQNFSIVAKPLYDLLKKDAQFSFGNKENEAFEALKSCLASSPVLAIYSPKAETELHCDARASGFGAILIQRQIDRFFRPVSYFSQRTTTVESRYHSFELECLAVVYAIKRYNVYLSGIKFKIVTDCDSFRLTLS